MQWNTYNAVLFDLDGVITPTAEVHRRAWTSMFNEFLADYDADQPPFSDADYYEYVDGKPRADGVRSFLTAREIDLPEAGTDEPHSVRALAEAKDAAFNKVLQAAGVAGYPGSIELLDYLATTDIKLAIVSSSKNAKAVLAAAGLIGRFPVIVDGAVAAERDITGKPAPDMFNEAAREVGVPTQHCVVVEDAISGVEAGAAGDFALVIGVERGTGVDALHDAGADVVVSDLAELMPAKDAQ